MRWRLLIEEYCPDLQYIQGPKNIVADLLSRLELAEEDDKELTEELNSADPMIVADLLSSLPTEDMEPNENHSPLEVMTELYAHDEEDNDNDDFPLSFKEIGQAQSADAALMADARKYTSKYEIKNFHGGGKQRTLLCYKDKIVIPTVLRQRVIQWYHHFLCHPGINRTEETIRQHLWWPEMRTQINKAVSTCLIYQKNKRKQKKYGLLPEKEAEAVPWQRLCVDLIGPYTIRRKGQKNLICKACTMIDPATGWFEIHQIPDKSSITVSNIVEQEWLSRYPWPEMVTTDRGSEFIGHEFKDMIQRDYGVKN